MKAENTIAKAGMFVSPIVYLRALFFQIIIGVLASISATATATANTHEITVDVEIVLAVDASGSVNKNELQLQLGGIARAFRDRQVIQAISQGQYQSIAVAMLIWSDSGYPKYPTEWFLVNSAQSAQIFAARVEKFNNRHGALTAIGGGGTGLGSGLAFALGMLEKNAFSGLRRVVDVSGDGPETRPWNTGAITLPTARQLAQTGNVTVNGLAIETDIANLTYWYRQNVLVGAGSFVITAVDFKDFARAIRKKLLREFTPTTVGIFIATPRQFATR